METFKLNLRYRVILLPKYKQFLYYSYIYLRIVSKTLLIYLIIYLFVIRRFSPNKKKILIYERVMKRLSCYNLCHLVKCFSSVFFFLHISISINFYKLRILLWFFISSCIRCIISLLYFLLLTFSIQLLFILASNSSF